jgi:hypothetical protein
LSKYKIWITVKYNSDISVNKAKAIAMKGKMNARIKIVTKITELKE